MENQKISKLIVESACILGRWLNSSAYFSAKRSIGDKYFGDEKKDKIQKEKHKILIEFESAILNSKNPQDMLFRISSRAGRLFVGDMPNKADVYLHATASGEIDVRTAAYLLLAFLRLRSTSQDIEEVSISNSDINAKQIDELTSI